MRAKLHRIALRKSASCIVRYAACATMLLAISALAHAQNSSPCSPSFPLETGGGALAWQGADVGSSIHLPDGRDVWLFGDTLYGPKRVVTGNDPKMVRNSIGISTCKDGKWHLDYVVKHDKARNAQSYFEPSDPKTWYWPIDGFFANGDLWVSMLCVRVPAKPEPSGFGFEICGTDLAQVSHLDRSPQNWDVKIHHLVPDGVKAYPSATTFVHNGYAYLFAVYETGKRPLIATRIPLNKLQNPASALEYLAADETWKPGLHPADAHIVMEHGAPELSIRYHPELQKWIAVMVNPEGFSDQVLLREAQNFSGPWSTPQVVYHIPEMQPGPSRSKNVFCYAGKEHPELAKRGEIVFTYACNTFAPPELVTMPDIYHPKVVHVPAPRPDHQAKHDQQ